MLTPLWQPENVTTKSLVFTLQPGEVALLVATGFERDRKLTSATEAAGRQMACLHHVITGEAESSPVELEPSSACEFLSVLVDTTPTYDEVVTVNCCTVSMSKCSNHMLWALPGQYYFQLNDTSAAGQAQIWIEIYKADELPLALLGEYTGVCHG